MSPFSEQPELWLTGHIQRLHQTDQATKIQAVIRGYIARRRKERKQKKLNKTAKYLLTPSSYNTLAEAMEAFGLDEMAYSLPTAKQALDFYHMDECRRSVLWHAKIALRIKGLPEHVMDLEWADYRERAAALKEKPVETSTSTSTSTSFFSRLFKLAWE